MIKILILSGYNVDNFFVQANNFINKIQCKENIIYEDFKELSVEMYNLSRHDKLSETIKKIYIEDKFAENTKKVLSHENVNNVINVNKEVKYVYALKVKNKIVNGDFDVIPLRFYSILMRKYPVYLGIQDNISEINTDNERKVKSNYFRVSTYMLLDNLSSMNNWISEWNVVNNEFKLNVNINKLHKDNFYNRVYFISDIVNKQGISRLSINSFGNLNKIIPCIFLDWDWYEFLSESMSSYINDFIVEENVDVNVQIRKDIIYKLQKEISSKDNNWLKYSEYKNNIEEKTWKKILSRTLLREFCLDNFRDAKVINKDNIEEFFNGCKNMSILSLLLFSSFCHFIYDSTKEKLDNVELNNLFQAAQDFSEALLQLIENALDYAEMSCLSFRIHSNESNYVRENYKEVNIKGNKYYLEVILTDLNYGDNIVETFKKNIKSRVSERTLQKELAEEIIKYIDLKGFFEPDKKMQSLWNQYYMIAENATSHYGLQLFNTLTAYYKGYFKVQSINYKNIYEAEDSFFTINYGEKNYESSESSKYVLPGTQYSILLPLKKHDEQKRVGIHIEPAYDDISLKNNWKNNLVCINSLFSAIHNVSTNNNREYKRICIKEIADSIQCKFRDNEINIIDIGSLTKMTNVELFSKAMISYILRKQNQYIRIALINVEPNVMLEFTRFFAIFYNKNGKCIAMKKTQIFLCDKECRTEITFAGEDLATTLAGNELWANAKGEYNKCLEMLQIILKQRNVNSRMINNKSVKVAPFELMVKDSGISLFERRVYNDLRSNIQEEPFGCLLKDIHMRVGSKMHVTDHFFETFQLFNSSLYNSRFAYLLAKKIKTEIKKNDYKNLVLVGYDVYSELLILETRKILKDIYKISARGMIYEQMPHPNFRMWEDDMKDSKFVIVVPTSTTLTTHGKIIVELAKLVGSDDISSLILLNVTLILIRDSSEKTETGNLSNESIDKNLSSIEKNYWKIIKNEPDVRAVWTRTTNPEKISYSVLVESKWQEPLSCKCCYPSDTLLDEKPIIEVNRGSVVPMIMAGPQESSLKKYKKENVPEGSVDLLKDVLLYGHCKRKNNHFKYYFKTDELMKKILEDENNNKQFEVWIKYVKGKIDEQHKMQSEEIRGKQKPYIYDILVAPIHETNASFLEILNGKIFNNVPIVLYMDSDREYRENILSKYSHLTALYNNIIQSGRKAIINFYYIDDCINSGVAFRRTHSLLQTLFPDEAYEENAKVRVNLFQNIILLLNRNSKGTIKGYTHRGTFFSYINLNISSLRNHHDNACAVCSEVSDDKKLKDRTSINSMAIHWKNIINKKGVKNVDKTEADNNANGELRDRYFRRLICTHEINSSLDNMGWDKNKKECVHEQIEKIIISRLDNKSLDNEEKIEYIMAYFTVLSRPYLSYRKSILDVVFSLLLQVLNVIINHNIPINEQNIKINAELIKKVHAEFVSCERLELKRDFVKVMISALSRLGASYLIRVDVLNKMFVLSHQLKFHKAEFELFYASAVKRLITLGKDESIGLWLEYLLVNEVEYGDITTNKLDISPEFKDFLFYENTYIIADALDEFIYKKISMKKDISNYIDKYYFENFRKFINIDYRGCISNELMEKHYKNFSAKLNGMIKLRQHLKNDDTNIKNYYQVLLGYVKKITAAKYVCIYGKDVSGQIYIIGNTDETKYSYNNFVKNEILRNKQHTKTKYLKDTVCFYKNKVFLCLTEKNKQKDDSASISNTDAVWLLLEYDDKKNQDMACDEIKFNIRNVLVNRNLLWERLQTDFKKDAFTRIKDLSIKNELLSKSKAGSHTPDEELEKIEKQLIDFKIENGTSLPWAGSLLQLASDSLVSKLYVEKIRDEGKNFHNVKFELSCEIFNFDATVNQLLNQMNFVNKDDTQSEPTYASLNVDESAKSFSFLCPSEKRFYNLYIVAALVQNAVNYGKADEDNKVVVNIRLENENLVFENQLKDGFVIERDSKKIHNVGLEDGITLPALKFYFKKYYKRELTFATSETKDKYVVKIPVVDL